jgi:rhamnogalacturonyl hydrolase YesR
VRSLALLRGNVGRLALKLAGALWPPNLLVVARNMRDRRRVDPWANFVARTGDPRATLDAALEQALRWLATSQDRVGTGGVGSYEFYGWTPGFPEVTGYIIPTIWDCRHALGREELARRAVRMADWELAIQKNGGGWEGNVEGANQPPLVFNTGQVIKGLVRTHQETRDPRYLEAAVRAGDWIVRNQEDDGSWTRANFRQMKRVYDAYVSAGLVRLAAVTNDEAYTRAAIRNCEFVLSQQRENGWFDLCDITEYFNEAPVTHSLCYAIDGLLETGELVGREDFVASGTKAADALLTCISPSGLLLGRLDDNWRPRVRWSCLTGSAQLGIILMKLYARTGDDRYADAARRLTDFLIYMQRLNALGPNRSGALPGAYPIWGTYAPFKYPCWATKFLIDLILLVRANPAGPTAPGQPVQPGRPGLRQGATTTR